tara:strand:- start:18786 stop:19610 length:825 start_codon:yes stop_codon:yes gene_type:complete
MSQHDFIIANQSFPATRTDLNNALAALASNSSGDSDPSTTYANQWWYETDTNILKIRNEDNNSWIEIATLDQTADNVLSITTQGLTLGATALTATGAEINALKVQGKETIYVPASAMYPNSTNGSSGSEQVELTNGPELKVLDFDPSTAEFAQFSVVFPKSWNEGTVTFQTFFTVNDTNTGTVGWGLSGVSIADDASTDTAFGTNVLATAKAHSGVANDLDVTVESGAVTVASAAEDCYTFFQIMRDATNDTQTADARLMGIKLFFTTNAKNDA